MRQSVMSLAVLLAVGCGGIDPNPGNAIRVKWKGAFEFENGIEMVQRVAPLELAFSVDGCDEFNAYAVSGDVANRRSVQLLLGAAVDKVFTTAAAVEALRPPNACFGVDADDSVPTEVWLEVECKTDGRSGASAHKRLTYSAAKRFDPSRGVEAMLPFYAGGYLAFHRDGYSYDKPTGPSGGLVDGFDYVGSAVIPTGNIYNGFLAVLPTAGDLVPYGVGVDQRQLVGYDVRRGDGQSFFNASIAASPDAVFATREWNTATFVVGTSGGNVVDMTGSHWEYAVTVTRVYAEAVEAEIFELQMAFFGEVLEAVSEGSNTLAPALLTRNVKTGLGTLRFFDGAPTLTTAEPLVRGDTQFSPDGMSWLISTTDNAGKPVLYTQTRTANQINAPVKLNAPSFTTAAFLRDGTLAVGQGKSISLFSAMTFAPAGSVTLSETVADSTHLRALIPLNNHAFAALTVDGVQLINRSGQVVGGAQPLPAECRGGGLSSQQAVRMSDREVAVGTAQGVYRFQMSAEDVAP